MKTRTLIVGFALLVVGGAVGYVVGQRGTEVPAVAEKRPEKSKAKIADNGESASLRALRARVRELERELAEKGEALKSAVTNAVAGQPPPPFGGGPREGFRERMERLKTEDPARYAEITNRWTQWRQRRSERQLRKMEFLSSIDTSRMDSAARIVHDKLQAHIARQEELEQKMHDENLSEEDRRALMEEMHDNGRQLRAFNDVERKNLIEETARNLGFEGEDVKEISATMREIIEATDNGFGGPHGHGHGRHGGRGGRPVPPPR